MLLWRRLGVTLLRSCEGELGRWWCLDEMVWTGDGDELGYLLGRQSLHPSEEAHSFDFATDSRYTSFILELRSRICFIYHISSLD